MLRTIDASIAGMSRDLWQKRKRGPPLWRRIVHIRADEYAGTEMIVERGAFVYRVISPLEPDGPVRTDAICRTQGKFRDRFFFGRAVFIFPFLLEYGVGRKHPLVCNILGNDQLVFKFPLAAAVSGLEIHRQADGLGVRVH